MLQAGLIIGAGVLLLVKKEFEWIQPSTARSAQEGALPSQSMAELFSAVQALPQMKIEHWSDLSRVDFKPAKGVVKFVAPNQWEAQFDVTTGELLQLAYRRSDFIESLHDGSYFAEWTKLYLFLPTAIILLGLWASGIYMFFYTRLKRWQKFRRLQTNNLKT